MIRPSPLAGRVAQARLARLGRRGQCGDAFPAGTDPGLLPWYADAMGHAAVDVLIRMSRIASVVDARPYLERMTTPTLGLYPKHAPLTVQTQEQTLRDGIANLKIVHVPSRHHTIQNSLPATPARPVLYFAAQHDGTSCEES